MSQIVINNSEHETIKFVTKFITFTNNDNSSVINFKNNMIIKVLTLILRKLNQKIGSDTTINYRINPVDVKCKFKDNNKQYKFILTFPIQQHGIESNSKLTNKVIDTLNDFIPNINWEHIHKQYLWLWRILYQLNYIPDSYIKYNDYKNSLKWGPSNDIIKKYEPKLRQTILKDGSKLKEIVDPFVNDYGLYINLSVPFYDMEYGYNYLHYYEHMMTYAWKNLSQLDMLEMNGATTCHSLCYVYNIHSNTKSLEEYLSSYLDFHVKTRNGDYWNNDLLEGLERELERTMSETLLDKSYANMAKTDPKSQHKYDINTLKYFSNKPFEIIIYAPDITNAKQICEKIINNKPTQDYIPKALTFNYYPKHVCRDKLDRKYLVLKLDDKTTKENCITGVDCYIKSDENLDELNTILMNLLLTDGIKLKQILCNTPIPNSNMNFGIATCFNDNINSYFENYNENV
jgi:hypothetical protein